MASLPSFQHATPAFRTFCGEDALAALPRELDRLGISRAVIVCGPWVREQPHALAAIEAAAGARLAACFDAVEDHSPVPAVEEARRELEHARADAVIAVGGGSAIVTARAATILLAEKRDVRELCTRRQPDGRLASPRLLAPKIPNWVVPTTPITAYAKAGSAVRDPGTGERLALFDPKTRAQGIFLDPAMALTAPASLVRSAALNAFAMAVESLQASAGDPLAEAPLAQALRMLVQGLPQAHSTPHDAGLRLRLMLAALLCGQGSDYVGGGLAQALSHAAGPRSSVSNGVIEALLLPHAMRYNAPVTPDGLRLVAGALGASPEAAPVPAGRAINAVEAFLAGLAVPARLRDVGITEAVLPEVADHAMSDWTLTRAPRPVKLAELSELLHAAL